MRLVTNIDPHELYLSQSIEELRRNYADPPTRSTQVEKILGETVATTRQASGYDGQPVVVEEANVDRIRRRIVVGDLVLTSDQIDLGTVKRYDATTGWMLITRRLQTPNDLMVPVAAVGHVDSAAAEIYLAASRADLRAMQHLEPVDIVFVDSPPVAAS